MSTLPSSPAGAESLAELPAIIASRDFSRLTRLFDPDVEFKALTPGGVHDVAGAEGTIQCLVKWFEGGYDQELVMNEPFSVGTRLGLRFRLRRRLGVTQADAAWYVLQQDWFADAGPRGIERVSLVCSGNTLESAPATGAIHEFDAGDLGCADGLPQEFMRRIRAIPIGDVLRVITSDPSAREDLPALARMNGHMVAPPEDFGAGRTLFAIERRK